MDGPPFEAVHLEAALRDAVMDGHLELVRVLLSVGTCACDWTAGEEELEAEFWRIVEEGEDEVEVRVRGGGAARAEPPPARPPSLSSLATPPGMVWGRHG